jgi:predicted O-linked N-acetylglucosamine transferase (SPINDLY family)
MHYHQTGQLAVAEGIYREILAAEPNNADATHLLGVIALQTGHAQQAYEMIRAASLAMPDNVDCLFNLGNACKEIKRYAEASDSYRRAIALRPDFVQAHYNLGNALRDGHEIAEAIAAYRRTLELQPEFPEALNNLGRLLLDQGRTEEAEHCFRTALVQRRDFAEALINLGTMLQAQEQLDEAEALYRRAHQLAPASAEVTYNLGALLKLRGRMDEARQFMQASLELKGEDAETLFNIGNMYYELGRYDEAAERFRQVLRVAPDHVNAHVNLGATMQLRYRLDEALAHYQRALELAPEMGILHNNIGAVYKEMGDFDTAAEHFRQAIAVNPDKAQPYSNLGNLVKDEGRLEEAIVNYRKATEIEPNFRDSYHNLLLTLNYPEHVNREEIFAAHRAFADRFEHPDTWPAHYSNPPEPERRLRIGYLSPDFRRHSVSFFVEPLIRRHDRERFEVFCYANNANDDDMTAHLKGLADGWRSLFGVADAEIARMVQEDRIDIFVDLAGHTGNGRMHVFSRKPAPVQVTYIGYPNTTGLKAMDYRLTDAIADPPGDSDAFYSEKLVRLPNTFLCYRPHPSCPDAAPRPPCLDSGKVTFGSFNILTKVTPTVIATWAEVLQAVPDSRLFIKAAGLNQTRTREFVLQNFAEHGIGEDRLELMAKDRGYEHHMARYQGVDICLDPFPYNGTTTTFDALWMGVPVITLSGDRHAARVGHSILANLGLEDLVAHSHSQYVDIATRLAADRDRLAELRTSLRERMRASPLMDEEALTRNVEAAYRTMWRDWCARQG